MVYHVIGLMSGSSLDGLDIVFANIEEVRGVWQYGIQAAECIPYPESWSDDLKTAGGRDAGSFLCLHTRYGRFLGTCVNEFIEKHALHHKVHFIASHGHTVYHNPAEQTSFQLGDGASLAAVTRLPVISDLRSLDVALGGQGAPIVPIGDKFLFGDYDYWLNIGGIVNMTVSRSGQLLAYDICPGNQMLNALARRAGKEMDEDGAMASRGTLLPQLSGRLQEAAYYQKRPPKSLSNPETLQLAAPLLSEQEVPLEDLLCTATEHIARMVAKEITAFPPEKKDSQLLVTGGGALNGFLVEKLQQHLQPYGISVIVPDIEIVRYKEALVMALIGTLRWREESNVLAEVTGAGRDSVGGALWMGSSYN